MVNTAHDVLHVVPTSVDDGGNLQLSVDTLLQDRLEEVNPLDLDVLELADDQTQLSVVVIVLMPVGLDQLLGVQPPVILVLSSFCLTRNKILLSWLYTLCCLKSSALNCKLKHLKSERLFLEHILSTLEHII